MLLAQVRAAETPQPAQQLQLLRDKGLLPKRTVIVVVTPNWEEGSRWEAASAVAEAAGCRLEWRVMLPQSVPTTAMRVRMRWTEEHGIRALWLFSPLGAQAQRPRTWAVEGGSPGGL